MLTAREQGVTMSMKFKAIERGGKTMRFNYSLLNGKIAETYRTQRGFSAAVGISEHSLSNKLNGKVPWKQAEMVRACEALSIPLNEIPLYFFRT